LSNKVKRISSINGFGLKPIIGQFAIAILALTVLIFPGAAEVEAVSIKEDDLTSFVDGAITSQLKQYNIPAATISVVAGDEILLSKGYGKVDIAEDISTGPERSIFRTGSVSKLFVWTAIMQLAERGELDLDRDINAYLEEVKIPDTFDEPITIRNLFTHTAGFEEKGIHLYAPSAEKLLSLREALAKNRPARVRPPGRISAYSNYGTALAGRIISNVSGKDYREYMEEYIFGPLQMENSTFRQPIPESLAGEPVSGYRWRNGEFVEGEFEFIQLGPAGAMSSTATDIANFMIAQLNGGQFKGEEILKRETTNQMHKRQYAANSETGGWTAGFIEIFLNGKRLLLHGGDTDLFHAGLFLIPQEDLGLYVAYNAPGGGQARMELLEAFLDRYFPTSGQATNNKRVRAATSEYSRSTKDFTGSYRTARSNFTTFEKVSKLFTPIEVENKGKNQLIIRGLGTGTTKWTRIGELTFINSSFMSSEKLFFSEGERGKVEYLFLENNPTTTLIKLPWWGSYSLQLAIPVVVAGLFLLSYLAWLLSFLYRKIYRIERPRRSPGFRITIWVAALTMACFLLFLGGFSLSAGSRAIIYGLTPLALVSLVFGIAGAVFTALFFGLIIRNWLKREGSPTHRLHWTILFLSSLVLIWWMNYWNLLGIKV